MKINETHVTPLKASDVGLPVFPVHESEDHGTEEDISSFELSSHQRAKQAIVFGLKMREQGAHVFVVGDDRSGRMTSTLAYLNQYIKKFPPPPDWIYLNNFSSSQRPIPYELPAGKGIRLKSAMTELMTCVLETLEKLFQSPLFLSEINTLNSDLHAQVSEKLEEIRLFANKKGLQIIEDEDQYAIVRLDADDLKPLSTKEQTELVKNTKDLRNKLSEINNAAQLRSLEISRQIIGMRRDAAERILEPLMKGFVKEFTPFIGGWIDDLRADILAHTEDFAELYSSGSEYDATTFLSRYEVNLLVDNKDLKNPLVYLEPIVTYENMFGSIKYQNVGHGFATDFTMIRSGALHRVNGGILVLRAEALAANPDVWYALKAALRDKVIRIEERHRENSMPMLDAPDPKSIPLDIQIFIIGAPMWYYNFFYHDPEFKNFFKVRADIDPDLLATPENIDLYTKLIRHFACLNEKKSIDEKALQELLGYSSRWTENRERLSARFELIADVLSEASVMANEEKSSIIRCKHVQEAFRHRRLRNGSLEDRSHQEINQNIVLIQTKGSLIGQINGLSVLTSGDHEYGLPNRISARTYAGKVGVINIERLTNMSGPIQQKGAMILDGYLNGLFSQTHPISCTCSITFEQNYDGIEGDSATLAELLAILSSLSRISIRQDVAVTGSVNQYGEVQAVGGVIHKIEGFFRLCNHRGLTGTQGVIIPKSNMHNVVLRDDVAQAIQENKFFIWPVSRVEEAIALMMGKKAGHMNNRGKFEDDSVFAAVSEQLIAYQTALTKSKS